MLLKSFLPKNSSLRFRININKKSLNLKKFKNLFILKKKNSNKNNSGRNNLGKITVRHKGAGLFNFRRNVDIYRNYDNINNTFIGYDIDKRYSCFLGLVKYDNGCINYIFAPHNLLKNQVINYTLNFKESRVGSTMLLGWIQSGTVVFNVENKPFLGGILSRSAGSYCTVLAHNWDNVLIRLPSKKKIFLSKFCLATIGRGSNVLHFLKNYGKAGISRYLNIRPNVRGETMNPIDHPNGGRTRGGKPRKNIWGKIIK